MRRPSLCTLSPWVLAAGLLLASCASDPSPEVVNDFGATPAPVTGASDTPTQAPEVTASPAVPPTEAAADPTTAPAVDRCTGRDDEAFIEVLTPEPGATVSSPFTFSGCGNTFEASYVWQVVLDGAVAAEGFGTMTCGSGCVGTYEETVAVVGSGAATLRVFEYSAEDGSEEHVVEVPITLG